MGAIEHAATDQEVVCLLTRTLVDAADPSFSEPTKFVGRSTPKARRRNSPAHVDGPFAKTARLATGRRVARTYGHHRAEGDPVAPAPWHNRDLRRRRRSPVVREEDGGLRGSMQWSTRT